MFFSPPFPSFPCSDGNAISEPAAVQANPGHLMYSHAVHLGVGAHISIRQAHTHTHTQRRAFSTGFHTQPLNCHSALSCPHMEKKKMQSLLCTCSISKVLQRVRAVSHLLPCALPLNASLRPSCAKLPLPSSHNLATMRNGDTFHRIPLVFFFFFKARHVKARIDPHPSEATEVTDKPRPLAVLLR